MYVCGCIKNKVSKKRIIYWFANIRLLEAFDRDSSKVLVLFCDLHADVYFANVKLVLTQKRSV